jgi:outer membrane receptor for ferrienterochelin and colicins
MSATIYFNRIDDKITQYSVEADRLELHYMNVSSATLRGVDVNMLWNVVPRWTVRGTYGFCDARDNATDRRLDSSPRHSGTASLSWTGWLTARIGTRAMSSYSYLTATGDTKHTDPQAIWRAALSREVGWGITVSAKVENVFDVRSIGDPIGRQILLGLKYKL